MNTQTAQVYTWLEGIVTMINTETKRNLPKDVILRDVVRELNLLQTWAVQNLEKVK